jgi:hypothetical protein
MDQESVCDGRCEAVCQREKETFLDPFAELDSIGGAVGAPRSASRRLSRGSPFRSADGLDESLDDLEASEQRRTLLW